MSKSILFAAVVIFVLSLASCLPAKRMYYFHDQVQSVQTGIDSARDSTQMKIQKGDRLSITVSCQDPQQTSFLNPFSTQNSGANGGGSNTGFLVETDGKIDFPLVGRIKVEDLSSEQAAALIKEKLTAFFKDPYVYVNLIGKVFFINGAITGGFIPVVNERLTVFEAVAQMGTIDMYDKKNQVWLIREEKGLRTFTKLDLNSKKIFISPYFYLHNNDLLYVMPSALSSLKSPNNPLRVASTFTGTVAALYLVLKKF